MAKAYRMGRSEFEALYGDVKLRVHENGGLDGETTRVTAKGQLPHGGTLYVVYTSVGRETIAKAWAYSVDGRLIHTYENAGSP